MPITTGPEAAVPRRMLVFVLAALAGLMVLAAGALWLGEGGRATAKASAMGGPFRLLDGAGREVTDRDLRGRYLLIYFGYTSCPDVCPTTLQTVASALDRLGAAADRIQPIFITVDPARDTPDVVGHYAASFSPRLIGLTGSAEAIAAVEKAFRVYTEIHRFGPGADDYSVDHSSALYLVGPDGRFVAPLHADAEAPDLAQTLARQLH